MITPRKTLPVSFNPHMITSRKTAPGSFNWEEYTRRKNANTYDCRYKTNIWLDGPKAMWLKLPAVAL